jgi:hypothetical protein
MKTTTVGLAIMVMTSTQVMAFPAIAADQAAKLAASQVGKRSTLARDGVKKRLAFDAASQYVDTTGDHKFLPPNFDAGDVRGPCKQCSETLSVSSYWDRLTYL